MNTEPTVLTTRKPGWFPVPPRGEIIAATRASLSRNLSGFPFPARAEESTLSDIEQMLRRRLETIEEARLTEYFAASPRGSMQALLLRERLLLPEGASGGPSCGAAVSPDERVAVTINALDHVRLVVSEPGFRPEKVWERADALDDRLAGMVAFAFDEEFGFLTASPADVGTGMHIEFVVHLPALELAGQMDKIVRALREIGFRMSALAGEEGGGHLYLIQSIRTLGVNEEETVADVLSMASVLENYEKQARRVLYEGEHRITLEDRAGRAEALLGSAKLLESREALDALSLLRLGAEMGLCREETAGLLYDLFFELLPRHLQLAAGRETAETERKELRARIVRRALEAPAGD